MVFKVPDFLNPPQAEAVKHINGPLLVFAGAGSGKTSVLTQRVANMIANGGISPENILAVTFTKKAANEMMERITKLLSESGLDKNGLPTVGTFHSIGANLIRRYAVKLGYGPNFSILDSDDSQGVVKEVMKELDLDIKQFNPKNVGWAIAGAKNELQTASIYAANNSGYMEDIIAQVYEIYEKHLKNINALDFGDLLLLTNQLLREHDDIRGHLQEQYKYIMVDEYQDTNKVQYNLVKHLVGPDENLCVVGDDDQSIYKWRGADSSNIINFENDFPNTKVVKLEQNYRSVGNVIQAATAVIGQNNTRVDKSLWTDKGPGDSISIYQARDEKDEADFVVAEIKDIVYKKGVELNDFAILYRTNYQSRVFEEALLREGFPYKLVGGFRFYERKEVKDILSYLRAINNPKDDVSFFRIANVPARKLGPKAIGKLTELARKHDVSSAQLLISYYIFDSGNLNNGSHPEWVSKVCDRIVEDLDDLKKFLVLANIVGEGFMMKEQYDAGQLCKMIVDKTNYIDFIDDKTEAAEFKKGNIGELINISFGKKLNVFLQEIALIEQEQDSKENEAYKGAVTLMTVHSAKGLEFPTVFMVGMEEGIFPHHRSFTDKEELEEERRLAYVGITRAKERLFMSFAEARMNRGEYLQQMPSQFLGEIPQDICEYYSWKG